MSKRNGNSLFFVSCVLASLFSGLEILSMEACGEDNVVYHRYLYEGTETDWDAVGGFFTNAGTTTGENQYYIGLGGNTTATQAVKTGNLTMDGVLHLGYYNTGTGNAYQGSAKLTINGNFSTDYGLHIGERVMPSNELPTDKKGFGYGEMVVTGDFSATNNIYLGDEGYASLIVQGAAATFGNANLTSHFHVSSQKTSGTKPPYIQDTVLLDLSSVKTVNIQTSDFLVGSCGLDSKLEGRYETQADVRLGTDNTITTTNMIMSGSFGTNLSDAPSTIVLGEGTNDLNVSTLIAGYYKSENYDENDASRNIVSVRLGANDEKTATVTLNGAADGELADLKIGYNPINTGNVAYGRVDLTNAKSVTMALDELVIGHKSEKGSGLARSGGGRGNLILGDHATVTANSIELGYKDDAYITMAEAKQTRGIINMGGSSSITTKTLSTGNIKNVFLISQSHINMAGGKFEVTDGVTFSDSVHINLSNGAQFILGNQDTTKPTMNMYADLRVEIDGKDNGKESCFDIKTNVTNEHISDVPADSGYAVFNVTNGGAVKVTGALGLSGDNVISLSDNSSYEIDQNFRFRGRDTYIAGTDGDGKTIGTAQTDGREFYKTKDATGTTTEKTYMEKLGQAIFSVRDTATVNLAGNAEFDGNSSMVVDGGTVTIGGTLRFDSTDQGYTNYYIDQGVAVADDKGVTRTVSGTVNTYAATFKIGTGELRTAEEKKANTISGGSVEVTGLTSGIGTIDIIVDGTGVGVMNGLEMNRATSGINHVDIDVMGGSLTLNNNSEITSEHVPMPEGIALEMNGESYDVDNTMHVTVTGGELKVGNVLMNGVNQNAKNSLEFHVTGGTMTTQDTAVRGGFSILVDGGTLEMQDAYQIDFNHEDTGSIEVRSGKLSFNHLGANKGIKPETEISVLMPVAVNGGTFVGDYLGAKGYTKCKIIQKELSDSIRSCVSPGDEGQYGTMNLYGEYELVKGEIDLELSTAARDKVIVNDAMTIAAEGGTLNIKVNGDVPISGMYERDGQNYEYVILLTAGQFNALTVGDDAATLLNYVWTEEGDLEDASVQTLSLDTALASMNVAQSLSASTLGEEVLDFSENDGLSTMAVGDGWNYAIQLSDAISASGENLNDLVAYRATDRPIPLIPEPSSVVLLALTGWGVHAIMRRRKG